MMKKTAGQPIPLETAKVHVHVCISVCTLYIRTCTSVCNTYTRSTEFNYYAVVYILVVVVIGLNSYIHVHTLDDDILNLPVSKRIVLMSNFSTLVKMTFLVTSGGHELPKAALMAHEILH
jgi:hypothetical protein